MLYEVLKARKGLPVEDSMALLFGRQTGGGGGSESEYFGAVPFEINAKGTQNAKGYTIYGNTYQAGTPTPEQPVEVLGVGNRTKNLFDVDTSVKDCYIDVSGILITTQNSDTSDYIPITGDYITLSYNYTELKSTANRLFVFYDENKNTITAKAHVSTRKVNTVQPPSYAKYVRIDYDKNMFDIMLNSGSEPLPYEPYGYRIPVVSRGEEFV